MFQYFLNKLGVVNTSIAGIGAIMLFLILFFIWRPEAGRSGNETITGDGKGYYKYLPSLIITGNFGNEPADYRYLEKTPFGVLNKYSAGTALLIAPFFSVAHAYYSSQGVDVDGYETGFQKMVSIAALFYFLLGIYGFSKLLYQYNFRTSAIVCTAVILAFGTNILVYVLSEPAFSHVYSFFTISFFLLFTKRYITGFRRFDLFAAAVFMGLTILIRPFDAIVVLSIPFLAGSWATLKITVGNLLSRPMDLIVSAFIVMAIFAIQPLLWYIQTGELVFYAYTNEGFYFDNPQIFNVLLGFRKGLFIYTPLVLISLLGLRWMYKRRSFSFFAFVVFYVILVYFISSWWNWYYGPSFSQRPFVDFYPLLFIPMGYLINALHSRYAKALALFISLIFIALNVLQAYQYRSQIISSTEMNFVKFVYIFGKTDQKYINVLGGVSDMKPYHQSENLVFSALSDFESAGAEIQYSYTLWDSLSQSWVVDYSDQEYNTSLNIPIAHNFVNGRNAFLDARFELRELKAFSLGDQPLLVVTLLDSMANPYYYEATQLKDVPIFVPDKWTALEFGVTLPIRCSSDQLHVYIWNKPNASFRIDNFRIDVFTYE